jgi:hypothetical protein
VFRAKGWIYGSRVKGIGSRGKGFEFIIGIRVYKVLMLGLRV